MFNTHALVQKESTENKGISRVVNLGKDLDLFMVGSCYDESFLDYVVNKVLDYSIEGITEKNVYKDFSGVLEHINSVLKTWDKTKKGKKMHLMIAILHQTTLLFSTIGKASVYLLKENNVVEASDRKSEKESFTFISNGELGEKDLIVSSNKRLLNIFSESDFIDCYNEDTKVFNSGLSQILQEEGMKKNIIISSLYYIGKNTPETTSTRTVEKFKNFAYKIGDKMFVKRAIAMWLIFKEKFNKKEKVLKGGIFLIGIIVVTVLLYFIVTKTLTVTTENKNIEKYKIQIIEAKASLKQASQNIDEGDLFQLNIGNAQEIIEELEKNNMFLEDVKNMKKEIAIMKKDFNGIESIGHKNLDKIIGLTSSNNVRLVELQNKMYIVGKKTITGPILKGKEPKTFKFQELGKDYFIDATPTGKSITLLTKKGKIVVFGRNQNFKITDVVGQKIWEKSETISSYNSNIYLVSSEEGQVYKHRKAGNAFKKGVPYLKKEDQKGMVGIRDIAIDGGIYMLKKDLSIVKFFSSKYRLETITIKNKPDNYNLDKAEGVIKIKAAADIKHAYVLLKNKIFIFSPNSRNVNNIKRLKYIGQIEGLDARIIDFHIQFNGEILILNNKGLYKLKYEVSDGKLLLK